MSEAGCEHRERIVPEECQDTEQTAAPFRWTVSVSIQIQIRLYLSVHPARTDCLDFIFTPHLEFLLLFQGSLFRFCF